MMIEFINFDNNYIMKKYEKTEIKSFDVTDNI